MPLPATSASITNRKSNTLDEEYLNQKNPYPYNPLTSENVEARRSRIYQLYNRIDHRAQGYLDADSIVHWLNKSAFDQSAQFVSSKYKLDNTPTSNSTASPRTLTPARSNIDVSARGALENIPLGSTFMYARELVRACDKTADGRITFPEFEAFVKEKEKELLQLFQEIDSGNDNVIHLTELLSSVRAAGIDVSEQELQQFIEHVDKGNDGVIDFFEWRDYLLLLPQKTTLTNVFKFFNTLPNVDLNADAVPIPDHISVPGFSARLKYFLAGGIAGAVSRTATAPLDRLKVLLQTQTFRPRTSYLELLLSSVRKIYQDGGILSFYRGNGLNIVKIIPESALKFFIFEYVKDIIRSRSDSPTSDNALGVGGRFISGGIAGLVSQFAIYPIETTKTRMMAQITNGAPHKLARLESIGQLHKDSTIYDTVRHMWTEGGIRAFYRGCIPALVGIVPYAGIDLAVFETLKQSYISWSRSRDPANFPFGSTPHLSTPVILMFGMISGTCGAVLVYPLSLVRTRLQAQGTPSHPTFYRNSFDVVKKTFVKEGMLGFYKGLIPTLFKVLPAVSISYWVYEKSKRALNLP